MTRFCDARVLVWFVCALVTVPAVARAQAAATPPPTQPPVTTDKPEAQPTGEPVDYLFPSGAGMLLFHVDPAKTAEFDGVISRLSAALKAAKTQSRQLQAASWHIYKSAEKSTDSVLYVFMLDPAIDKTSYDPLAVIGEILPAELQPEFERMKASVLRIERLGLTKIR